MIEDTYSVCNDGVSLVATNLKLEAALILAQGYFEKYYAQPGMKVKIKRLTTEGDN